MIKLKNLLKPNSAIAVLIYVVIMFLGTSIFAIFFGMIAANVAGIPLTDMMNALSGQAAPEAAKNLSVVVFTISTFLGYLLLSMSSTIYTRDVLYLDFLKIKKSPKKFIITTILFAAIFYAISSGIDELSSYLTDGSISQNQQTIIEQLTGQFGFLNVISVIFLAPVVEEIIFRKCIFKLCENFSKIIPFILSTVSFSIIHMVGSNGSGLEWILIYLPYFTSGLLLTAIYYYTKENVYASIFAHFINNLVAVISIFVRL